MLRVTQSLILSENKSNVDLSSSEYQSIEQELATGKKLNAASDNPSGASQAMTVRSLLVDINQYQTNANSANNTLQFTDSQLNSINGLIVQARTIAVAAANGGTQDASTQQSNATQIQSIIDQLTTLANSQYNNQYIFSGQQTTTAPYTPGDATHTYNGDEGAMNMTIGSNSTVQTNIPGDQIFQSTFTALEQLKTDITAGDASAVSNNDLPAIDTGMNAVTQTRAQLGVKLDLVQNATSMLGTTQINYQNNLAQVEDADLATTYTQLQTAQTTYQASLIAVSKAMQYSLAQYL